MILMLILACARQPIDEAEKYSLWLQNEKTSIKAYDKPQNIRDWSFRDWNPDGTEKSLGIRIPQQQIQEIFRTEGYPNLDLLITSEAQPSLSVLYSVNPTNIHRLEYNTEGMILYDQGDVIFDPDVIRSHGFTGKSTLMYGDNLEACIASQYELPITL